MTQPLRVGNASGFYGDRFAAVREMLTGGDLDVLTGDYLAELTMLILGRDRLADPAAGYARTFLRQLEDTLGLAVERGVRIVSNAGGLNPAGLAEAVRALAGRLGVAVRVAYVTGDDLLPRAAELGLTGPDGADPLTANAYLGCRGIAAALDAGADVVVTGRVTDASLVVGPAVAHFGWKPDDFDALAGATVAGHLLECGAQVTGGNYAFFTEIDARRPGFPLAEIHADGSCVVTKHPGTGGAVTPGTVTAQLLYEIAGPRYPGPDVTTRFDTVRLAPDGPDRVRVTGAAGEPPPSTVKVCVNRIGGYRNELTFPLTGLDVAAKAELVETQLRAALADPPAELRFSLARTDTDDASSQQEATALLRVTASDPDSRRVGRAFSGAAVELGLASYPGASLTAPPADARPFGLYEPAYVPNDAVEHVAVLPDGTRVAVPPAAQTADPVPPPEPDQPAPLPPGPTRMVPLGRVAGARSGDKGGDANIGVWVRDEDAWRWLAHFLTVEKVRELLPETADLAVDRYLFPHLRAVNVVVGGILGTGMAAGTRFDPQGKGLGEWLRARLVPVPVELLSPEEAG